ncbi:saccharopine dehydrogenase family protein [Sporosarcina pasteurii]|uniref:Saccharopine dehydrogenase n=1 Tax=Sporosarcina pasteurii TaxID=1474 RepID=A0A380BDX1_SPOPA|nr:saccharopine dehydrogenase C-terminal domain-containing protein [Sporosarcina pasteurii]MDS9472376.1 saccharopine dehydrogenase C-terminal domain-containing protein [Sporosarcina pasteurii]QBQ06353.1 saccharopine dehydrogenase [Sporosarcina pasteurii]SUI98904.1 Saccharopine dehydrogenase [Sporosarcina pasteurii]
MKVVVLGAGLMGKETARDLVKSDDVDRVYLADINVRQAEDFAEELMSDKLDVLLLNANNDEQLGDVIALGDVVVNALFYTFNEKVARIAIEKRVHSIDLGGHIGGATEAVLRLTEQAKANGVTLIPDLGVAPGMINILTGYGAQKLDEVETIKLYVGGIPVKPEPPLNYNVVFSLEGVFDHYTDPSHVIRNGKLKEIPSLSEIEVIHFDEYGELEAFHTSGGTSTLTSSFSNVQTLEYKTIRYPGHAEKFQLLVELGLLSRDTKVTVEGQAVKIRDVMREHLSPKLYLGEKSDAVLLRVIVSGEKDGARHTYEYDMVTEKDTTKNITAMARATASTMSIVAQMVGRGTISKRGVYPPENIVPGEEYIKELKKRGVVIRESIKNSSDS